MKNKRGDGYVLPCVLILCLCMVISVLLSFSGAISILRYTKENVEITLDGYVQQCAIEAYNSIKQGTDHMEEMDAEAYLERLCQYATLDLREDFLYSYGVDGEVRYYMTTPELSRESDSLQVEVRYTQYVPIKFPGGIQIYAAVPVMVTSTYESKF